MNPKLGTLRDCWLTLDDPALSAPQETDFSRDLRQRHAGALDALVAAGQLDPAVAAEIAIAFDQSILHAQNRMSFCYIAMPSEALPRGDLTARIAALQEMAARSAIDPATLDEIRLALERDVAWLAQFDAGHSPPFLHLVAVSPQDQAAARVLVDLLLGEW